MNCPTCGAPPEPKSGNWDDFTRVWRTAARAINLAKKCMDESRQREDKTSHQLSIVSMRLAEHTARAADGCLGCRNHIDTIRELREQIVELTATVKKQEAELFVAGANLIEAMAAKESDS